MKTLIHHVAAREAGSRRMPKKRSSDPDTDTDVPGQAGWQVSWMGPPGVETAGTVISPSSYLTVISYHSHVEHGDLSQVMHLITEVYMKYLPENHRLGTLKGSFERFTNTKIRSFVFFQCMYPANKPLYRLP